jgi:two-component system, OmpR family, sensor histidine kinase CiaH
MLRYTNIFFVLIFCYTIMALLFWHNSLQKQNDLSFQKDLQIYQLTKVGTSDAKVMLDEMIDKHKRKHTQYIGEGATFLIVILAGAVIVLLSFRKRLQLTTQQNNFMLSVTHELKTPLAGIKLSLETLRRRRLTEEQFAKMIDNSVYETERLNELCNNILLSTQLDGKQYMANAAYFNIKELIDKCMQDFMNRYPNIEWQLHNYIKIEQYKGDAFLWRLVINNLLENARKYAGHLGSITLDAFESNSELVIQILDEGIGIVDAEKKKIFQKFYRSGDENTRTSKGTGLGLHIVKRAIEWHGGTITMEDNKPKGNIAIILIPKNNE